MEETELQPGPSGRSPQQPLSIATADELGFARYEHQPEPAGQQPQRGVVKFRYARNHFFGLQWAIEHAWQELNRFRQEIHELVKEVEREHFTHSDTTLRLRQLDERLRSMVKRNARSLYGIGSHLKSAQREIGWALERRGLHTAADDDYERAEQVLLALAAQPPTPPPLPPPTPPPHKFGHKVRRVMEWIRHGSFRQKPHSDGAQKSLLGGPFDVSYEETKQTVTSSLMKLTDVAGLTNCKEASDVDRDGEMVASGHEGNSEEKGDAEKSRNSAMYDVLQKLWQQHRELLKTLGTVVQNLRENDEVRPRLPESARGRGEHRLLVVGLANDLVAAEAEVRAAMVHVVRLAARAARLGTEAWPELPLTSPRLPADPRHPTLVVTSTCARRRKSVWRNLCCV